MEKEETLNEKIGRIVSGHAVIEFQLAGWLGNLINKDYIIGKIVTCEMSCKNLTQAFQSICKYKASTNKVFEEHYKDVTKLVAKINKAEQERNLIAHSININVFNVNLRYKETSKQKNGFTPRFETPKNEDYETVLKLQYEIAKEFERLQPILK